MKKGFSKLSKTEKIAYLKEMHQLSENTSEFLSSFYSSESSHQQIIEGLTENAISTYHMPFSIAPNFLIDGQEFSIPMVIEESSVVAAASKSASFWAKHGGFKTRIHSKVKSGQVHFLFSGDFSELGAFFIQHKTELIDSLFHLNQSMKKRGGGLIDIQLLDLSHELSGYGQLELKFDTLDAMGANFINSNLEATSKNFAGMLKKSNDFSNEQFDPIMSILSNYSPECIVSCSVDCPFEALDGLEDGLNGKEFAEKFQTAIRIAELNVNRAVTHNKGILNGIDAVVLATGNDWRAVEANAHAFAAKDGKYKSLSSVNLTESHFCFELTLPMQIGTIGGVTRLHPMANFALSLLGNPTSNQLMSIIASAGLASNFAAIRSLISTGIQKGHMKLHLSNVLLQLNANEEEVKQAKNHFKNKTLSVADVKNYLSSLRNVT